MTIFGRFRGDNNIFCSWDDKYLCPRPSCTCISNFTFLRGASHPEELVARAYELGYAALAITDECSLAGIVRAHVEAKKCSLPLIIGSEFRLDDGLRLVLLATDRESYGRLSALITRGRRSAVKGSYRLTRADLGDRRRWLSRAVGFRTRARRGRTRWLSTRFRGSLPDRRRAPARRR
jgi:error-prone DNA polymerase